MSHPIPPAPAAPAPAVVTSPRDVPTPDAQLTLFSFGRRELPRLEHGVLRCGAHVCGRGGIHSICPERSLLQVSRSTQKLLPVPKVSEQKTDQR